MTSTSWPARASHQALDTPKMPAPKTATFIAGPSRYGKRPRRAAAPGRYADCDAGSSPIKHGGPVSCLGSDPVRDGREGVCVEGVGLQPARFHEVAARGLDHDRGAASVDLKAGQVGQIFHDRLVDQAGAPRPAIAGDGLG